MWPALIYVPGAALVHPSDSSFLFFFCVQPSLPPTNLADRWTASPAGGVAAFAFVFSVVLSQWCWCLHTFNNRYNAPTFENKTEHTC